MSNLPTNVIDLGQLRESKAAIPKCPGCESELDGTNLCAIFPKCNPDFVTIDAPDIAAAYHAINMGVAKAMGMVHADAPVQHLSELPDPVQELFILTFMEMLHQGVILAGAIDPTDA